LKDFYQITAIKPAKLYNKLKENYVENDKNNYCDINCDVCTFECLKWYTKFGKFVHGKLMQKYQ